jgi:sulfite reductase (NADPH) flavoprotein alpha-component
LTILFGSQTGTAESLAKKAAKEAGRRGFAATVLDMAQTSAEQLVHETNLLVITSTYGDGEPPDNAKALHAALIAAGSQLPAPLPGDGHDKHRAGSFAPAKAGGQTLGGQQDATGRQQQCSSQLSSVRFSVCALGDTNYTLFCQCGKDLDAALEKLGAARVAPRVDCDLDYEAKFTAWLDSALVALSEVGRVVPNAPLSANPIAPAIMDTSLVTDHSSLVTGAAHSRSNPFPAPVRTVRCLNAPGSAKEVNHVVFSLEGSGLVYEPGDALGVLPQNCPELVAEVLAALGCDGEEAVPGPTGASTSLRRVLTECYDLGKPSSELLALVAPVVAGLACPEPGRRAAPGRPGSTTPATSPHHVIDVLLAAAVKPDAAAFVVTLKKLQPRLYSIASSPRAHPGQVHLTVGAVRYEVLGLPRKGVCSTFLADRCPAGSTAKVFVHTNNAFRPPAKGDTPMIMVGPGTGIAPFRAFLEERTATGAAGRNWLFFGDQRAATDFLYRDELFAWRNTGTLTRLDLAFSRDQSEKIYVQHRMLENAVELYAWLEAGAHFYVCGDASRMAKDVDAALHKVIETAGGKSAADAATYVQALKAARRYARDVY